MRIDPFKLGIDGRVALSIAEKTFGRPSDISFGHDFAGLTWFLYEDGLEIKLEIAHVDGNDTLKINFLKTLINEDMTICAKNSTDTLMKLKNFIDEVKKPWIEWEEGDILSSPIWVCLYKEEGNEPTPAMESKMVMESYGNPKSQWIRRYFDA